MLTEVCYLLQRRCGSLIEARFLRELAADDRFALVPIVREDLPRVAELVEQYQDFPLGGVMIRSPEVRYSCPDPANPEGPRIACPTTNGNAATLALKPTGFNYDLCGAALPLWITFRSFFSPYSLKNAARSSGRSLSRMPTACR